MNDKETNSLLDKKWFGGLYHIHHTNDTWEQWINDFESTYQWPEHDAEKINKIIGKNLQYIKNKKIIDLACNLGYFTLSCSNLGATSATGVEVRQSYIDTFNKIKKYWPHENVNVINSSIENIDELKTILTDIDTILYTGHFYHTMNHLSILKAFTESQASCLILESTVKIDPDRILYESILDPLNGYTDPATEIIPVRSPSLTETKNMLIDLGWTIVDTDIITGFIPNRFVITAIKDNGES